MQKIQLNFIKSVLILERCYYKMKKLYGICVVFILWYLLALIFKEVIPYPHQVIINFYHIYSKNLKYNIYASIKRLLIGLTIAIFLGVHIGIILGLSKKSETLLAPIIYAMYPIPKAALLPVFIILLGIGDLTKISLIIIIVIFPIIINIKDAVKIIPNEVFYIAKSLSLNKVQMYKEIIIPAITPGLLTATRIGIGTSVAVLYLSESITSDYGLGYYISIQISISNLNMFTGIFTLSVLGYLLFILIDILEYKLCKWV